MPTLNAHEVIQGGETRYDLEAPSQNYISGAPLLYDSNKQLAAAGNRPTAIAGFAIGAATGVENERQAFLFPKDALISLPVYHATPANAITAQSQITGKFSMRVDAGLCSVDIADTSAPILQVQAIDPLYPVGTQYGRLICKITTAGLQLESDAT